jgi:uncharacterized protein (DUF2147 family)
MTSIPFLKGRIVLPILISLAIASPTTASGDQSLAGRWTTQDRSAVINFAHCGTRICATVIEGKLGPSKSDMLGKVIIKDVSQQAGGGWAGRFVGDGHDLPVTLKLVRGSSLDVRMCMMRFLCKTQHLVRIR